MSRDLRKNIKAFEKSLPELESHYMDKFVVFHDGKMFGSYDSFDVAAREALRAFGEDVFLVRQVGGISKMPIPASIAYNPAHASR